MGGSGASTRQSMSSIAARIGATAAFSDGDRNLTRVLFAALRRRCSSASACLRRARSAFRSAVIARIWPPPAILSISLASVFSSVFVRSASAARSTNHFAAFSFATSFARAEI